MRKKQTEAQLQIQIVNCLELEYKRIPGWFIVHLPQEGKRDPRTGAYLKRMGWKPGLADLMIFGAAWRVGFMEVKLDGGKLTPAQEAFRETCRVNEVPWALVRSLDQARTAVAWWRDGEFEPIE